MTTTLKCKMCGGDIELNGNGTATCKYCGTVQIVTGISDEKKINLLNRAEHYRSINEFDRAESIYEQILSEDSKDAEIYWDIVLCRYGIEYVEDPKDHNRIPTVHRVQYKSILEDKNYLSAIEYATEEQKIVLQKEAGKIDGIQKGLLEISKREEPYDVFICYKETDNNGERTLDSVLAQDLYANLVKENYRVFFSRITLENKLGTAYEPYIFAALNSAKVMVVIGTSPENYNAVWVKNEWSRYLSLINEGENKTLIPAYKDMDVYDLPEEFAHLQAQDMSKIGYMQDLVYGIRKLLGNNESAPVADNTGTGVNTYKLRERITLFLNNGEYDKAKEYCERILDVNPSDADAYCKKLCAEYHVKDISELSKVKKSLKRNPAYINAIKFGSPELKEELEGYLKKARSKGLKKRLITIILIAVVVTTAILGGIFIYNRQTEDIIEAAINYINEGNVESAEKLLNDNLSRKGIKESIAYTYIEGYEAFIREDYDTAEIKFKEIKSDEAFNGTLKSYAMSNASNAMVTFNSAYDSENYKICFDVFDEMDPEVKKLVVTNKQEEWYDKAIEIQNEIVSNPKDVNYNLIATRIVKVFMLMKLCDEDYKDVKKYNELGEILNVGTNLIISFLHPQDIGKVKNYSNTVPMINAIIWLKYYRWLEGEWKGSSGDYFTYKDNQFEYNLPFIEMDNSYIGIDLEGNVFIYSQDDKQSPPVTAKDMFKFTLINENQIEAYCYKDGSTHMLYRD